MTRRDATRSRLASAVVLLGLAAVLIFAASPAQAQAIIKVSDTVFLKFGALLQPQADWTQLANATNTDTAGYSQNLFLRRARFYFGARFAKNVYFYFVTENSTLGKGKTGTSALGSGFQLLDGFGEWRISDVFILDGGLLRVPYAREALKAASSQFTLDTSAYNYLQQTATGSTGGNRDTGFMARGFVLDHRLEYRVGVFQGARLATTPPAVGTSHNSFRTAGRLQFNFFDREDMYSAGNVYSLSYAGSYLGDKKILAVGTGFDTQGDYNYYSGDMYTAIPTGNSGGIEGTLQYQYLSGGKTFTSLPTQNTVMVEGGYYFKSAKVAPLVRYEQKVFNGQEAKNEARFGVGFNYYPYKFNFNIKTFYSRIDPKTGPSLNQFTVQLQFYYF